MLKCYPLNASQENWLHESLVCMIQEIHSRLDTDKNISEDQNNWKTIIPNSLRQDRKQCLIRSKGIKERLFIYKNAVQSLNQSNRRDIFSILLSQNKIANLLSGIGDIAFIEKSYPEVHKAVKCLFVFCFKKLTDFGVRTRQYQIIFDSLETKICPFCGIERMMNPEETAQDQDHYLAKSIYPFAAANMRNIVPMCRCCNRDYKRDIDVLRKDNDQRRLAFDPYCCTPSTVTLVNSTIDNESSPLLPSWRIEFVPDDEQTETWDSVFQIRARYERDILNKYFTEWLRGFSNKCTQDRREGSIHGSCSPENIKKHLANYCELKKIAPNVGMAGFLEPLVFEFLLRQYDEGNSRIIQLIRDAVVGIRVEDVV